MIQFIKILLLIILSSTAYASFYDRHAEGWFWYQDPKLIEEEEKKESANHSSEVKPKTLEERASEALSEYKKQLQQKLHLALVSPTPVNVGNYMAMQKDMMERSNQFADVWQQVLLTRPDLNREVKYPTSQYARHVYEDTQRLKKEKTIQSLSNSFGLFYFFKENCPYCQAFAPIVKMFAEKYQWDVMAISMDGSPSSVFAHTQRNNGIAEALNITSVPALIAYNDQTQDLIPISYAATSMDQLEDNIMALVGDKR